MMGRYHFLALMQHSSCIPVQCNTRSEWNHLMSYSASYTSVANGWNTFVSETLPRDMHVCQNHLHVLITEKKSTEQTLSFDFLNPSKFFLKEHGYSLPHSDVLAYTMCQGVGSGTGEQVPLLLLQLKTLPNKYNCGISSFIYYNCVLSLYLHKHNK